jgi:hypothetical protein
MEAHSFRVSEYRISGLSVLRIDGAQASVCVGGRGSDTGENMGATTESRSDSEVSRARWTGRGF